MDKVLEENRKARRIAISNVPYEFNVTEKDMMDFITTKMFEYSLNDAGNKKPVVNVWQDLDKLNSAIVEFSS
jgi:hypothetical protein